MGRCCAFDHDRGPHHGDGEAERVESFGKGGAPGLAAFPVDGSVSVDGFAEGDLKAGRNDLANGEAQGNPIAEAGECRVRRRRAGFRVRF